MRDSYTEDGFNQLMIRSDEVLVSWNDVFSINLDIFRYPSVLPLSSRRPQRHKVSECILLRLIVNVFLQFIHNTDNSIFKMLSILFILQPLY